MKISNSFHCVRDTTIVDLKTVILLFQHEFDSHKRLLRVIQAVISLSLTHSDESVTYSKISITHCVCCFISKLISCNDEHKYEHDYVDDCQ